MVFFHKLLGIGFAGLDNGRRLVRPKGADSRRLHGVHHAQGQRVVRRYYHKINGLFFSKCHHGLDIRRGNIHAFCQLRNSAVSRRAVNFLRPGILGDFPNQRMLAAAAANN